MRGATRAARPEQDRANYFNPRTPCGVRQEHKPPNTFAAQFQSTHPLRGATELALSGCCCYVFQSTHPLRGATCTKRSNFLYRSFQSTHPLRGATIFVLPTIQPFELISIHAPLAGCDSSCLLRRVPEDDHFNPRTPCGVRLYSYSTRVRKSYISIHAPLAGCDTAHIGFPLTIADFNPRTPCGVRPEESDYFPR